MTSPFKLYVLKACVRLHSTSLFEDNSPLGAYVDPIAL